jgi:hypothetical protein
MPSVINATTTAGVAVTGDNSGALALQTNNGTTAVTIDTSQNVGVGITSPTDKLDVARNSSSNSTSGLTLTNTSTSGYGSAVNWNLALNSVAGVNGRMYCEAASSTASFMAWQTTVGGTLAERMRIDSSGNLAFNSGYGSVATAYGCRAWVYFGTTGTIKGSGNVSSVSKNSTGNYTVSFTNSMPDSNYSAVATGDIGGWSLGATQTGGYNAGSISIQTRNTSMTATDAEVSVAVFR